ncbi:MAG: alpha/beta hydrolase [Vicinamibacteria bacterium]
MRKSEGEWRAADGAILWRRSWEPDGPPRAAGVLVHGLGEHSGRYDHVGERFARAGLSLLAFDLRGHGRSSGARGDTRFGPTLEDVDRRLADAAAAGAPVFLYGHSLGALLVLTHLATRRPSVAGAVVSAPPLRNALRAQRAKVALARLLGRLAPGVALANGLDASGLSRDPAVVDAYRRDPLVHDRAGLGLARDAEAAIDALESGAATPRGPLLVVHGGADPVAFPEGSRALAERLGPAATLLEYEGLRHEAHNEPERGRVLDDVISWMLDRLPRT